MKADLRLSVPAVAVMLACTAVVVVRVVHADAPPKHPVPNAAERAQLALIVKNHEPEWIEQAARHFPSDRWSQRDDFHGHELRAIVDLSAQSGFSVEDVLRAIDDDIHLGGDDRNANAAPCKPRPFYD